MQRLSRDEVIAALYAAAPEPDALARIAGALRSYLDTDSAGVWLMDRSGIREMVQTPDIAESVAPYLTYYRTLDPWSAARKAPGQVFLGSDTVDEAVLVRSEFYQDFARHYGMLRPMGLILPLEPGALATIALNRTESRRLLGEEERAVLQNLSLHLQAALNLRGRILADREMGDARASALDAVSFGVVVCEADARVRAINRSADALARVGVIAVNARDVLVAGTPQQTGALQALIRAGTQGKPGAMRLQRNDGTCLSVLVTPVCPRGDGTGEKPRALVSLRCDDAPAGLDAATLVRLFGISPAQAELCLLLLAGRTFEEAAAERGIATSTARSYFMLILARTGTRNLRDLLRLLGSLPQVS